MTRFRWGLLALLATLASGLPVPGSVWAEGGTLLYALDSNPRTLDPAKSDISTANIVIWHLTESLVAADADGAIRPALATAWTVSDDGRTWTFRLREGVRFHDGTPFDAGAVRFNFLRQMAPAPPGPGKTLPYLYGEFLEILDRVEALDARTVRLVLKHPYGPLLNTMANNYGPMAFVSPAAYRQEGEAYGKHPVGTGPFKFERWVEKQEIVLGANRDYWAGPPRLERVTFVIVPDAGERVRQLLDGGLHVITDFGPHDVERIMAAAAVEFLPVARPRIEYLGISNHLKPYTDPRVRRAVAHAINVDRTVLYLTRGTAIPAHGPMPPGLTGYDSAARQAPYDPARARTLLAEAGLPQGFRTSLMTYAFIPGRLELGRAIQADLEKVGIQVDFIPARNWDEVYAVLERDTPLLFTDGWTADFMDPDNVLFTLFYSRSPSNYTKYRSPEVDALLLRARKSTREAERAAAYQEIQRRVVAEAPSVFLTHPYVLAAHAKSVRGLTLNMLKRPVDRLWGVELSR
jgi:peptide/nickel transport system substrate-binding protein